jgi:hypothetical protein
MYDGVAASGGHSTGMKVEAAVWQRLDSRCWILDFRFPSVAIKNPPSRIEQPAFRNPWNAAMSDDHNRPGLSLNAMAVGVMVLAAYFCWALAASAYLGESFDMQQARRAGRGAGVAFLVMQTLSFLFNSVRFDQLPGIVGNAFTNDRWVLVLFLVLEVLAVGFWMWMRKLEAELAGPAKKRRRRRQSD